YEAVEEGVALGALGDAGNLRVLPWHTDAGVPHDEFEEPCLALGEPMVDDGPDAGGRCQRGWGDRCGLRHRNNSSATLGVRPPRPLLPPPLPLMRRLDPP